jgi:hypothetical protein
MHIKRRFTTEGQDPDATVPFRTATSEIRNPDGSVVFQAEGNRFSRSNRSKTRRASLAAEARGFG